MSTKPKPTQSKTSRGAESAEALLEVIIKELREPASLSARFEEVPFDDSCADETRRFLQAKFKLEKRMTFIKSEPLWFRKYGWFMVRVVVGFGFISLLIAALTGRVGAGFVTIMILGAAAYYLLLVTASNIRYRESNKQRRAQVEREYCNYHNEIALIASDIIKRYRLDPSRFEVKDPMNAQNLVQRDGRFFFKID